MKKTRIVAVAITFLFSASLLASQNFSPDQLDNLLAPVALYPDPLLAQVLTASTFVDQVEAAAGMLNGHADSRWIDAQPWDVSVKSVAHYPGVLRMMSEKPDWTTSLGQAYVTQSTDVVGSIQRLRTMAHNQGNLISNRQQEVILNGGYVTIDPIQAQFLFVPVYNPAFIYYRRGNFLSFGAGFAIGAWLNVDFNWGNHGVFYHGWGGGEGGWIGRSRGYVSVSNSVYINNNFRNVQVNREVVHNTVNYNNLSTYNSVHNTTNYNNVAASHPANVRAAAATPARAPERTAAAVRPAPEHTAAAARPAPEHTAAARPAANAANRP